MTEQSIRILLLEDNQDEADLLIETLIGISPVRLLFQHVTTAAAAVEKLRSETFDAALVDLSLPDARRLEALQAVQQVQPSMPVVVLTGAMDDDLGVSAVQLGAEDYLTKGQVEATHVLRALRYAIERRRREPSETGHAEGVTSKNTDTVIFNEWPQTVAGCRLRRVIGRGTTAYVFLAEKEGARQRVQRFAVKMLIPAQRGYGAELELRFLQEARIMAEVIHPNIVRVLEYGKDRGNDIAYMIMELVQGTALTEFIGTQCTLTWEEKLDIVKQLASALKAIHQRGICHRDIKPTNILVTPERIPKLLDFGIAKLPESRLTVNFEVMGTPVYMAPESFDSSHCADHRADIFSIGVLTYELLLGRRPFQGTTIPSLVDSIRNTLPVEPRKIMPELPLPVQNVLSMMLKKKPEARYASIDALLADLQSIMDPDAQAQERHRFWPLPDFFARDRDWN